MNRLNGLLLMLTVSQLFLFFISFYEYSQNEIKLAFLIEGFCFTYCMATLYVLLKYDKNQDNAESN